MKIKILDREFNDKNFWLMFDPNSALEYFIPNCQQWRDQGITLTLEDSMIHDRFLRHIEIWAESQDEKRLNLMLLKGFDK